MKLRCFPLALLLLLVAMNFGFAAVDAKDLVGQSVRRWSLQTELPKDPLDPSPDNERFNFQFSPEVSRWILRGALVLGVLVIAWSLRDSLPVFSRSRKITAQDAALPVTTSSGRLEEAQIEADDLARRGYYGEAMHVLLLKSLNEIRRQLGISFAVSLTSREILRRVQLSEVGRQALTAIIQSVEYTYYGGRNAGQHDYSNCRSNFETLKRSLATTII